MSPEISGKLWLLQVAGGIQWHLPFDGPEEVPVGAEPGWSLLTPLGAARLGPEFIDFESLHGEVLFASSRFLVVRCGEPVSAQTMVRVGPHLLSLLRYASCQATIPRTISAYSCRQSSVSNGSGVPRSGDPQGMILAPDHLVRNAITQEHLARIRDMAPGFVIPVCVDVLLDALEAHVGQDYRKALLFGAVAVETLALERLETAHASAISRHDSLHRVIALPIAGGVVVEKDPVYDALSKGDDFGRLLHERPLYLSNRSLLREAPETYRRALQLYTTRNKIVHRGTSPDDEKHFSLTPQGAADGLSAAVDVFRWFGDTSPYTVARTMLSFPDGAQSWPLWPPP